MGSRAAAPGRRPGSLPPALCMRGRSGLPQSAARSRPTPLGLPPPCRSSTAQQQKGVVRMQPRLRTVVTSVIATLGLAAALAAPAAAAEYAGSTAQAFPDTIALPGGFQPEGIAIGQGPVAYFGSLADGSIYRANLVTGTGSLLSSGSGAASVGLKIDNRGRLFVSGGSSGDGRVIDARTGTVLADYQFATGPSFVNDDIVAGNSAWFTDSVNPVLYRLPLGPAGQLPAASDVQRVPLTG